MKTVVLYDVSVDIPDGISDLAAFRGWAHSDDFPEAGRICFLDGRVWVDMSKEQVFTHNQLKQEFIDTETLPDLYWRAGIPEYWVVDARADRLRFDILRYTATGYTAVRKRGGWLKSQVFGSSFRLSRQTDAAGNPEYTWAVR